MAKRKPRKTNPEERARWAANQRRLERLVERRLEQLGMTREELMRSLGLPNVPGR